MPDRHLRTTLPTSSPAAIAADMALAILRSPAPELPPLYLQSCGFADAEVKRHAALAFAEARLIRKFRTPGPVFPAQPCGEAA